jgi:hypothetical protein
LLQVIYQWAFWVGGAKLWQRWWWVWGGFHTFVVVGNGGGFHMLVVVGIGGVVFGCMAEVEVVG